MRLDSFLVRLTSELNSHFTLSCNIFTSPEEILVPVPGRALDENGEPFLMKRTQLGPTPLHLFLIRGIANEHIQLVSSGQSQWFEFNSASTNLEFSCKDVDPLKPGQPIYPIGIFASGLLFFECIDGKNPCLHEK